MIAFWSFTHVFAYLINDINIRYYSSLLAFVLYENIDRCDRGQGQEGQYLKTISGTDSGFAYFRVVFGVCKSSGLFPRCGVKGEINLHFDTHSLCRKAATGHYHGPYIVYFEAARILFNATKSIATGQYLTKTIHVKVQERKAVTSVRDDSLCLEDKGKRRKLTWLLKKHVFPGIMGNDWSVFPRKEEEEDQEEE
eukprot:g131.t1